MIPRSMRTKLCISRETEAQTTGHLRQMRLKLSLLSTFFRLLSWCTNLLTCQWWKPRKRPAPTGRCSTTALLTTTHDAQNNSSSKERHEGSNRGHCKEIALRSLFGKSLCIPCCTILCAQLFYSTSYLCFLLLFYPYPAFLILIGPKSTATSLTPTDEPL